jgi:DNA primase
MVDVFRRVLGVRLRTASGRKFSVTGGHDGLFIPINLETDLDASGRLLVTEGPTDCAAMLDFGFCAVGRSSCTGGVRLLVELAKQRRPAETIIVSDADTPGQRGAGNLAAVLLAYSPAVRIITPPTGIKDARQWKQRGATAADVAAAIDAAPVQRLAIVVSRQVGRKAGRHGRPRTSF